VEWGVNQWTKKGKGGIQSFTLKYSNNKKNIHEHFLACPKMGSLIILISTSIKNNYKL